MYFHGATARPSSCFPNESVAEMTDKRALTVVTYNIHKGLSQFNKRVVLHGIREGLMHLAERSSCSTPTVSMWRSAEHSASRL